ncbi:MAG: DsbA family protein, partial [Bacteroidota bacterium]
MKSTELIYVGDPMCSWCWGAALEITQLKTHYSEEFDFRLLLGGLRPGTTHPWKASQRQYLRKHWEEIAHMTGQPFRFDILAEEGFIYDTEIPSRAVYVCRLIAPDKEFSFFKAVQFAFYAQNKDTNQLETYLDICKKE